MNKIRRHALGLTAAAAAVVALGALFAAPVAAQTNFPNRPIRIIVPYPAGGSTDFMARKFARPLGELLGQPVIVDNKPGASATIGTMAAAASPPDGYTMVLVNGGFIIAPILNRQAANYDPVHDFAPLSMVEFADGAGGERRRAGQGHARVHRVRKVAEQRARLGSAGPGSYGHVAAAMLAQEAGVRMTHIPYKGEAPMTMALRTGEIKALMTPPSPQIMSAAREGSLRVIGQGSHNRRRCCPALCPSAIRCPAIRRKHGSGCWHPKARPEKSSNGSTRRWTCCSRRRPAARRR